MLPGFRTWDNLTLIPNNGISLDLILCGNMWTSEDGTMRIVDVGFIFASVFLTTRGENFYFLRAFFYSIVKVTPKCTGVWGFSGQLSKFLVSGDFSFLFFFLKIQFGFFLVFFCPGGICRRDAICGSNPAACLVRWQPHSTNGAKQNPFCRTDLSPPG